MRRRLALAVFAGIAAFPLLASARSEPAARGAEPQAVAKGAPVLALVPVGEVERLAWLDPVSLRQLRGRRPLLGSVGAWAFSPERRALAVSVVHGGTASESSGLRLVDLRTMRPGRERGVGKGFVAELAWPSSDRIVAAKIPCCTAGVEVLALARPDLRILKRASLDGSLVASGRTAAELVLLTSPPNTIGPATLTVVEADGTIRSLVLERVGAGWRTPDEEHPDRVQARTPGLAVDPAARHAYVVTPERLVADVDLAAMTVTYHDLARPSLLTRLRNWLFPAASAKVLEGSFRYAHWLGGGLVGVSGYDSIVDGTGESARMRTEPAGLELLDVRRWTARKLDERSLHFVAADGMLLATGTRLDYLEESAAVGVTAYRFDGTRLFRLFDGERVLVPAVSGGRAYVSWQGPPYAVVDLAGGRVIGERMAPLPRLLSER